MIKILCINVACMKCWGNIGEVELEKMSCDEVAMVRTLTYQGDGVNEGGGC